MECVTCCEMIVDAILISRTRTSAACSIRLSVKQEFNPAFTILKFGIEPALPHVQAGIIFPWASQSESKLVVWSLIMNQSGSCDVSQISQDEHSDEVKFPDRPS
jgi:hypothetical protein